MEKQSDSFSRLLSYVSMAAASAGIVGSMLFFLEGDIRNRSQQDIEAKLSFELEKAQSAMRAQLEEMSRRIEQISASISDGGVPPEATLMLRVDGIQSDITHINEQLRVIDIIQAAVTENPERAMSIPILRRDLDSLADDIEVLAATGRTEIDRLYDMGKWFFALIGTMAVGLLGTAWTNLRQGKKLE